MGRMTEFKHRAIQRSSSIFSSHMLLAINFSSSVGDLHRPLIH